MFSAKEIALRYGDDVRIAHVIIRDSSVPSALNTDFTSDEIMKTLNMDSLYTCVLALRDEKDRSREFKLTEAPNHSMSTSLLPRRFLTNSQVRNLREDTVYQIISECIIDDIVQSLPDEKKLTIIEEFKKLDLDGSGYIDRKEAVSFYTEECDRVLDFLVDTVHNDILEMPQYKDQLLKGLEIKAQFFKSLIKTNVDMLMAGDENRDGKISLQEFFKHEAKKMLALTHSFQKQ